MIDAKLDYRYKVKDEKFARLAFYSFTYFYEKTMPHMRKDKSYDDFAKSKYWNSFIEFGRYLVEVNVVSPDKYLDYLISKKVKLERWSSDTVYEEYIIENLKIETPQKALERSVLTMKKWADECNEDWAMFFKLVTANRLVFYITAGKLSPWILYHSKGGLDALTSFSDEQLKLVNKYISPIYWNNLFDKNKEDVIFVKQVMKKANI